VNFPNVSIVEKVMVDVTFPFHPTQCETFSFYKNYIKRKPSFQRARFAGSYYPKKVRIHDRFYYISNSIVAPRKNISTNKKMKHIIDTDVNS
jgi:hypothetical protein